MDYYNIFKTVLNENKDHLIDKNNKLNSNQKEEIKDFFRKRPTLESEITWQNEWDYEDFLAVKIKHNNILSLNNDLSVYTEGEDYLDLGEEKGLHYYVPLNCNVQKEVFQKKCPNRWCISKPEYWNKYLEKGYLYLIIANDKDHLCMKCGDTEITFWNSQDRYYGFYRDDMLSKIKEGIFTFKDTESVGEELAIETNIKAIQSDQKQFGDKLSYNILTKFFNMEDKIIELTQLAKPSFEDDIDEIRYNLESLRIANFIVDMAELNEGLFTIETDVSKEKYFDMSDSDDSYNIFYNELPEITDSFMDATITSKFEVKEEITITTTVYFRDDDGNMEEFEPLKNTFSVGSEESFADVIFNIINDSFLG